MREVCRIFLPVSVTLLTKILELFRNEKQGKVESAEYGGTFGDIRIMVPGGDDSINGDYAAFPGSYPIPDWIAQWFCRGAVGQSSHSLATYLAGGERPQAWPNDDSDQERCIGLLESCPDWDKSRVGNLIDRLCKEQIEWRRAEMIVDYIGIMLEG